MSEEHEAGATGAAKLFWIGKYGLLLAAVSAVLRSAAASGIEAEILRPLDPGHAAGLIAAALGIAFFGFAAMLFVTSVVVARLGMRVMLLFAAAGFIVGPALVVLCDVIADGRARYDLIWLGMLINGLAWGATEATINPMVAVLYPDDTTGRMNRLHAYWPAGIIIGGLLATAAERWSFGWRFAPALVPLLTLPFAWLVWRAHFPKSVRQRYAGTLRDQLLEIVRRPSFFIWFALMFATAATELAPGQWIDIALTSVVGMRGILLMVYVSGLMFVGRHFAGPLTYRLKPEGLLGLSSILAAIGLYLLSVASSPATALVAATLWGAGVCFMWPTMIATVADRYPRGGPWPIGLTGVAGALSSYFVLPQLGAIYDTARVTAAGGAENLINLTGEALQQVQVLAARQSFQALTIVPVGLIVAFAVLWLYQRRVTTPSNTVSAETIAKL